MTAVLPDSWSTVSITVFRDILTKIGTPKEITNTDQLNLVGRGWRVPVP